MALPGKLAEAGEKFKAAEAKLAVPPPVINVELATLMSLDGGADLAAAKQRVMALVAGSSLAAVRAKLGLEEKSSDQDVLMALDKMIGENRKDAAAEVVAEAVKAGKVTPAQRAQFVQFAEADLEGTKTYINSLPVLTEQKKPSSPERPASALSAEEKHVCKLLDVAEENFLKAK